MKLKKLLAAVVAGVLALTMAPIAVSAAANDTIATYSGAGGGIALNSLSINGKGVTWTPKTVNTADANAGTFSGTVSLDYSALSKGFPVAWNIPAGAVVSGITGTAFASTPSFLPGGSYSEFVTLSGVKGGETTTLSFTLTNTLNPWKIDNVTVSDGASGTVTANLNKTSATYSVTISITAPTPKQIQTASPAENSWGQFTVKNNATVGGGTGGSTTSTYAYPGDTITLSAPSGKNPANNNADFHYYKFSTAVEIDAAESAGGFKSGPLGVAVAIGNKYEIVYGEVGATISLVMPDGPLTITAFDINEYRFGTKSTSGAVTPGTNTSNLTVYGSQQYANGGTQYVAEGTLVSMYPTSMEDFSYWTVSGVPGLSTVYSNYTNGLLQFTMPNGPVTVYANNYNEASVTAKTNGYGSATASRSTANYREVVTFTASDTGSSNTSSTMLNDPYYYYYGGNLGGSSYYYPTYTYYFDEWTFNRSVEYVSGYTAESNPTKVYMTTSDLIGTANFTYTMSGYPYIPTTPSTPSTTNSYTNNGATATINTSTGVVTAGINSSGSVNSTATNNALKAAISRKLVDGAATVVVPSTSTGLSKSTVQKLITAAGSKGLRIQIQGSFGTITVPVSSARQINTRVLSSSNALTSAKATFKRVFGNTDIVGIQTSQASTFGSSATYRISADAIGLGVDYGDTAYVAIYNPETGKYSKKTVMVNANGQIAFASSYSGIFLFSAKPFSAK